jgi:hypothetical protein
LKNSCRMPEKFKQIDIVRDGSNGPIILVYYSKENIMSGSKGTVTITTSKKAYNNTSAQPDRNSYTLSSPIKRNAAPGIVPSVSLRQ